MTDRAQDTEAIRAARQLIRDALHRLHGGDSYIGRAKSEAAEEALARLVARLEAAEQAYAALYRKGTAHDRAAIAELCDVYLDRSGAMLGHVRALAAAAPGETGQTP